MPHPFLKFRGGWRGFGWSMGKRVDSANRWFAPRLRRAVPSAPGVGRTRHPVSGAVWQPRMLYGNLLQMRQLATFRSPWFAHNNLWFPYGNLLILLGVSSRPLAFSLVRTRKCLMPTPRTKSISTKVTEEEYALFEAWRAIKRSESGRAMLC